MEPAELPRYQVLSRMFVAPHRIEPGSIISYTGEPADHLLPLNDAAKAKMEEWYDKEVTTMDLDGKPIKIKPNVGKRPATRETLALEQPTVILHSTAPPETNPVAIGMERPLQPDLPIVPLDTDGPIVGLEDSSDPVPSLDGTLTVVSTPPDTDPGSASVAPPSARK